MQERNICLNAIKHVFVLKWVKWVAACVSTEAPVLQRLQIASETLLFAWHYPGWHWLMYWSLAVREEQTFVSYFSCSLNSRSAWVTHDMRTNCHAAIFPLRHKSLQHIGGDRGRGRGVDGAEGTGGDPTAGKVMEEEAQLRCIPLWLVYEASNIQTWNFPALNLRNPAANSHLECRPEQPTLWFCHFYLLFISCWKQFENKPDLKRCPCQQTCLVL